MGAALAYYHVGTGLLWRDGLVAFAGVILATSFGAHGINDVYDWITAQIKRALAGIIRCGRRPSFYLKFESLIMIAVDVIYVAGYSRWVELHCH